MPSDYLEEENEKRRRRAKKLGLDELICSIFFTEGLRYYSSWSQDPNWVCASISDVRESAQLGSLGFTLRGRRYSVHAEEDPTTGTRVAPDTKRIKISLLLDGNLVFGETLEQERTDSLETYTPQRVTAFVEGDWIEDFRHLQRELKSVAKRNLQRIRKERAQKDAAGSGLGVLRRICRAIVPEKR